MGQEQEQELGKVAALAQDTAEEQARVRTMEQDMVVELVEEQERN
jgi:hypothetical protein